MECFPLLLSQPRLFYGTSFNFVVLFNRQLRSLKYVILSDAGSTVDVGVGNNRGKSRRIQFLSGISVVQLVFMWLLTGNA